jgi:hypothetical protein
VRIVAPMSFRVPAAMERLGLDEKQAIAHIQKVDRERERWTRFLYGIAWQDASLYDLVVNLEHLEVGEACAIISTMASLDRFGWTEETRRAVADEAPASLVAAELAKDESTRGNALEVTD